MIAPPRRFNSILQVKSNDPMALAPAPSAMKTVENPRTKHALRPRAPALARTPT